MEPPKTEGERWRRMPLSEVADSAMDNISETHKKASIELQRRLINALHIYGEASEKASSRLTFATWVIVILTVALILLGLVSLFVN
jgi:hypothetical protein